ncbi:MAG TPA: hypothetical protein ENK16_08200 [Chromatiales bacterium]|nr:hypothetical protein [Chromatiales bacterium]
MDKPASTIIYVPGIRPKPPADIHRANLWRCLLEGVRRVDDTTAGSLARHEDRFRLVPWPHVFYSHARDPAPDEPGLERLLALPGPEPEDISEAEHWHKRFAQLVYLLADRFPFLIDHVATPDLKETLQDSLRYLRNEQRIADRVRDMVRDAVTKAWEDGQRILLIGHSFGSVIAFDVLWQLSREQRATFRLDTFLTLGSPLGMKFVRHRLLGARAHGLERYPDNIRRWVNLAAIGDLTALERRFARDYRPMLRHGLVECITDNLQLKNYFRGPNGLNVHKCYGYMINPETASVVARWWRS